MVALDTDLDRIAEGCNTHHLYRDALDDPHLQQALMNRPVSAERRDGSGFTRFELAEDSHLPPVRVRGGTCPAARQVQFTRY